MSDTEFDDVTECLDVSVHSDGIDDSGSYKFICSLEHTGHQSYAQSFGVYFSTEVSVVEVPGDVEASARGNHIQLKRNNQMNENGLVDIWIKLSADVPPEVTGITDITCLPGLTGQDVPVTESEKADPVPAEEAIQTDTASAGEAIQTDTAFSDEAVQTGAVYKAILERRSIRNYKPDMVPKEIIRTIMQAGTYAATGMNRQSPVIIAISSKDVRDKLSALNARIMGTPGTDPFYGAPVVLAVLADKNIPTYIYDGSLVMGTMMLAAEELGIGSCWIHRAKEEFESEEGKEILRSLGIEGSYEGIGHLILGYAEGEKQPSAPRKENYMYYID